MPQMGMAKWFKLIIRYFYLYKTCILIIKGLFQKATQRRVLDKIFPQVPSSETKFHAKWCKNTNRCQNRSKIAEIGQQLDCVGQNISIQNLVFFLGRSQVEEWVSWDHFWLFRVERGLYDSIFGSYTFSIRFYCFYGIRVNNIFIFLNDFELSNWFLFFIYFLIKLNKNHLICAWFPCPKHKSTRRSPPPNFNANTRKRFKNSSILM